MFGNIFKKRRRHLVTDHVKNNDLTEPDKNKLLKGEIILTHCRGHDTILTFLFEDFMSSIYVYFQEITVIDSNGLLFFM